MDSLEAVRERCQLVYGHVRTGKSAHWTLHSDAMNEVADYMRKLINRDYSGDVQNIPPHSRCRHHSPAYLSTLTLEQRVDLIVYSALLDAGAGDRWRFEMPQGTYVRSEGIAQAVQLMFTQCFFERDLEATTIEDLEQAFQVTPDNPMAGLHARLQMLHGLGRQLRIESSIFPTGKPHDLLLQRGIHNNASSFFRHVIMPAFGPLINPPRGDIWPYQPLSVDVPFHKLLQWLTLSILDAGKIDFPPERNVSTFTGLAEYRNGGLFVDMKVLEAKFAADSPLDMGDERVVEWRACTVVLIDKLLELLRSDYPGLQLPQLLECGTWKAGRELAALLRPTTKSSPIPLNLEGNVF